MVSGRVESETWHEVVNPLIDDTPMTSGLEPWAVPWKQTKAWWHFERFDRVTNSLRIVSVFYNHNGNEEPREFTVLV